MLAFITLQLKAPENAPVCITYNYNIHYITHSYIHTLHHIKKKKCFGKFQIKIDNSIPWWEKCHQIHSRRYRYKVGNKLVINYALIRD